MKITLVFLLQLAANTVSKNKIRLLLTLVFVLYFSMQALIAQKSKKELEYSKKELYHEIENTKKNIDNTQKSKKNSINELKLLQQQISHREKLVAAIKQETDIIDQDIEEINEDINKLNKKLEEQKNAFAASIQQAYLTKSSYNKLLFLFSANDFNDIFRRYKYLQYYSNYSKNQIVSIDSTKNNLEHKITKLQNKKNEKEALLMGHKQETQNLHQEEEQENVIINELEKKEQAFRSKLKEKQSAINDLDKVIKNIVKQANQISETNATGTAISKSYPTVDKDKLSLDFVLNKGKLPWPVDEGYITERFGVNNHPVLKNIQTQNNGIDIATQPNSNVRAIFGGKVSNIVFNPTMQYAVIVKHGNYFTVYTNLVSTLVSKGDEIKVLQTIGIVYTDEEVGKTEAHLEIWHGSTKLDPSYWLKRK